jgi:hypothetical protein
MEGCNEGDSFILISLVFRGRKGVCCTGESELVLNDCQSTFSWPNALRAARQKLLLRLKSTMADGSYIVYDSPDKKFISLFHVSSRLTVPCEGPAISTRK